MVRRARRRRSNPNIGYDVISDEYVDMVEAGIIDPAKVTRSAVENAASIAGMILTTEALITDKPEEKPAACRPCRAAWTTSPRRRQRSAFGSLQHMNEPSPFRRRLVHMLQTDCKRDLRHDMEAGCVLKPSRGGGKHSLKSNLPAN